MILLKNEVLIDKERIKVSKKLYKKAQSATITIPEGCRFTDRNYEAVLTMKKNDDGASGAFYEIIIFIDELNIQKTIFVGHIGNYSFEKACEIYKNIINKIAKNDYSLAVSLKVEDVDLILL